MQQVNPPFSREALHKYNRREWVIPENIHALPRATSWNFEGWGGGGGGVPWTGLLQASGGYVVWNSKSMGGGRVQL